MGELPTEYDIQEDSKTFHTDFLVSTPNLLTGMGSTLNLAGHYYAFNYSKTPEEADRRALECDLRMIGEDFKEAFLYALSL